MKTRKPAIVKNEVPGEECKVLVNYAISKTTLEKLEERAALRNTTPENLADEMIEKGLRKRTARDPKKLETLVRLQQDFNDLIEGVDQDDLRQDLTECMRRFLELW
ncbi:MAG: hypothetical protein LUE29_00365 [Lachnospiraceae bacterium]|nr:hypothetical protein [Lachnospiraceae bacterium]